MRFGLVHEVWDFEKGRGISAKSSALYDMFPPDDEYILRHYDNYGTF